MKFSKADRAVIDRLAATTELLVVTIDALTDAISERTKQLKVESRVEMQSIRLLTELLEVKPKRQPTRTKAP